MISYILQTIVFQAVFLIIYDLFHKKDTFFTINRVYLLVSSLLSLILPLLKFEKIQQAIPRQYVEELPTAFLTESAIGIPITENLSKSAISIFNTNYIMITIYFIGVTTMLFWFLIRLNRLYRLKKKTTFKIESTIRYYQIPDSKDAFSFWNMIFVGDTFSAKEKQQILAHEIIHSKERHTLDLLWCELLKIVFWFNPLIYLYHSRITLVHEYISDSKAIQKLGKNTYFEQLLNTNFETTNLTFTNNFFTHHFLKNRVVMIQKTRSRTRSMIKYGIAIPIILGIIFLSSFIGKPTNTDKNSNFSFQNEALVYDISTNPIVDSTMNDFPFAKVEQIPLTTKCQSLKGKTEQKKCVSNEIKDYVTAYFNLKSVSKYANSGVNRIYVRFKIDMDGKVVDVVSRGPAPELEKEAVRVVSSLPQMIPGEHDGKKVNVLYSLPIVFKVEDDSKTPQTLTTSSTSNSDDIPILTEKLENHSTIAKGYYLITNIFKNKSQLEKGLKSLKEKKLDPKVFQNPKDTYYYVYLQKFPNAVDAKRNFSNHFNGMYDGAMYILRIE